MVLLKAVLWLFFFFKDSHFEHQKGLKENITETQTGQ